MSQDIQIQLFESAKVRYLWDEEKQQYFFSVVDVIQVLTDSPRPRKYWNALKTKLQAEGSEVSQNMGQLKLPAPNSKRSKEIMNLADFYYRIWRNFTIEFGEILQKVRLKSVMLYKNSA